MRCEFVKEFIPFFLFRVRYEVASSFNSVLQLLGGHSYIDNGIFEKIKNIKRNLWILINSTRRHDSVSNIFFSILEFQRTHFHDRLSTYYVLLSFVIKEWRYRTVLPYVKVQLYRFGNISFVWYRMRKTSNISKSVALNLQRNI